MAKRFKIDIAQLLRYHDNLQNFDTDAFLKSSVTHITTRLLRKTKKRTPYITGDLRRAWKVDKQVTVRGNAYTLNLYNDVKSRENATVNYSPYVEFGHRQEVGRYIPAIGKKLKEPWVEGRHMLRDSTKELEGQIDGILKRQLMKKLKELDK